MSTQKIGDLELDQDMAYERRFWVFERVGWVAMAGVVALALLGVFGEGPVSQGTAGGSGQGLIVEYERIARRNSPQTLRLGLTAPPGPEGKVKVSLDRKFLESIQVESVSPEPESEEGRPRRRVYEFAVSGGEPTVDFKFKTEAIGWLEGTAAVEGMPAVNFRQFVYP